MIVLMMLLITSSGLLFGYMGFVPVSLYGFIDPFIFYCLCLLLCIVGYGIGAGKSFSGVFKSKDLTIILVPVGSVLGAIAGGAVASLFITERASEAMAVGAGFGWYSYSAVYISEMYSADLGAVAFFSNIMRELLALALVPVIVKYFCPESAISAAGATSMDVSLPLVVKYSAPRYAVISFIHGTAVSVIAPFLIPFLLF